MNLLWIQYEIRMRIIIILVILVSAFNYSATENKTYKTKYQNRIEIEAINKRIEQLYINENTDSLISFYTQHLTFFAEYMPAIFERKTLKNFYKDWFRVINVKTYKKEIYKVEVLSDYLLELGKFKLNYSSLHNSQQEYDGNYMIMWKKDSKGEINIVSEAFGSDKYIEAEDVPYKDVNVEESIVIAKHNVSKKLQVEIEKRDDEVIKAVVEGNGDARANGFTQDGIYKPHFDSMLVGMNAIRPYMLRTYKPGSGLFVKHTYNRIIDLGEFVFINAHFKGGWGDSITGGRFEGNMSNLMKRDEKGILLMHRQLSNNDRKTTIIKK